MSDAVDDLFSTFGAAPSGQPRESRRTGEPSKKRLKTTVDEDERSESVVQPSVAEVEEVIIETYESDHNCLHECVRPKPKAGVISSNAVSQNGSSFRSTNREPACTYPYELDPFQAKAISCLEAGESVLVSAHTSAGKTTVAEVRIRYFHRSIIQSFYSFNHSILIIQ